VVPNLFCCASTCALGRRRYTLRTAGWRYVAWVRVVGYRHTPASNSDQGQDRGPGGNQGGSDQGGGGVGGGSHGGKLAKQTKGGGKLATEPWQHNNLMVNWSYPPYAAELYDHRQDLAPPHTRAGETAGSGRGGDPSGALLPAPATMAALWARGGGFDLGESASVLSAEPETARALFSQLRAQFDRHG